MNWLQVALALIPMLPTAITDIEQTAQEVKANGWNAQDVKTAQKALDDLGAILASVLTKL